MHLPPPQTSSLNPLEASPPPPMDSLQPSNDSFSYNWLVNPKPSFFDPSGLDDSPRLSLDAVDAFADDPKVTASFHFCPPAADPAAMAHADQMFDNGRLLPLHLTTATASVQYGAALGTLSSSSSSKSSASSLSSSSSSSSGGGDKLAVQLFGECAKSSKRFIYKYLSFLLKGLGMMGRSRRRRRRRRSGAGSSRSCMEGAARSTATAPTASDALASFDWSVGDRASDDLGRENAIEDAILHCKNSIINGEGVKEM